MCVPIVDEVYERVAMINEQDFAFAHTLFDLADAGKEREIEDRREKIEERIVFIAETIKKINKVMEIIQKAEDEQRKKGAQDRLQEMKKFSQDVLTGYYKIIHGAYLEISDRARTALRNGLCGKDYLGRPIFFPLRNDEAIKLLSSWLDKHGLPDTKEKRRLLWEKIFRGKPIRHFKARNIREVIAEIDGEGLA